MPNVDNALLIGERLYLRGLVEADVSGSYIAWLNDQVVCAGNSHAVFPYGVNAAITYIKAAQERRDALVLAVVAREGSKHIGNIALQNINAIYRSAELSILIGDQACWGQGYGLEAAQLICRHGFDALNLHRIYCGTYATNIGMQKLANALGMSQEGVRRQAAYKAGNYVDVVEYGMLKGEFVSADTAKPGGKQGRKGKENWK